MHIFRLAVLPAAFDSHVGQASSLLRHLSGDIYVAITTWSEN